MGVGCDGLNLGTVLDGQIGQYGDMVEQFIQNAPALAIMYLAYSQPTVKSVIDELNAVGQFGLDLSNLTCSGVRQRADKAYEENMQVMAEADCTVEEGYKSAKCMSGDGITSSLITRMKDTKNTITSRATSLMNGVSGMTGGLVGVKGGGSSSGSSSGSSGEDQEMVLVQAQVLLHCPARTAVPSPKMAKPPSCWLHLSLVVKTSRNIRAYCQITVPKRTRIRSLLGPFRLKMNRRS